MNKTELNDLLYDIKNEKDRKSSTFSRTIIILTCLIITIPLIPIFIIILSASQSKYYEEEKKAISYLKEIYHQEINDFLKNELFIDDEKLENLIEWSIKRGEEDLLKKLDDFFLGKIKVDEIYNFNYTKNQISKFHIDSLNKKSLQNKAKQIEEQKIKNLENFINEHKEYKIIEFSVSEAYKNTIDLGMQLDNDGMLKGKTIYFLSNSISKYTELNSIETISGVFVFGNEIRKKRYAFVGKINRILELNPSTIQLIDERNLLSTVYLNYFRLQKSNKDYSTNCWKCKSPVSSKKNFLCPHCKKHFICSECGSCVCDYHVKLWKYNKP